MAGTSERSRKAAETNLTRFGNDFYKKIGRIGGKVGRTGGFASHKVGNDGLTGPQRASKAGRTGGRHSRRPYRQVEGRSING